MGRIAVAEQGPGSSRRAGRTRAAWLVRGVAILVVFGAIAVKSRADGVVQHELVPGLSEDALVVSNAAGDPVGVLYEGSLSTEPRGGQATRDERVLEAVPHAAASAETRPSYRPDRLTSVHSATGYFEIFTPSVAPFKRVTSFDRVALAPDRTPVLTLEQGSTRPVPIVGLASRAADGRARDRFLGSVVVDFTRGRRVAIPSVSPESRLLQVRTEPAARVHFEVDAAGNYFVALDGDAAAETRVTFVTDAPRGYFNQAVPALAASSQTALVPAMPRALRERALGFARELGVKPADPLSYVLEVLVEHFRSFREADAMPRTTSDIYLDLARGRVGVCRHRAYAFVITAQALGIPAHYVENEAHAWVEVRLGDAGWSRIDLGGSSRGVEAHGLLDRAAYEPKSPDPFPRPPTYLAAQEAARTSSPAFAHAGVRDDASHAESRGPDARSSNGETEREATDASPRTTPLPAEPSNVDGSTTRLVQVALHVDGTDFRAYRGRALEIHGHAVGSAGAPEPGLTIVVAIRGPRDRVLGTTITRADGAFDAVVGIPPDLEVADYALVVSTPGDATRSAAEVR